MDCYIRFGGYLFGCELGRSECGTFLDLGLDVGSQLAGLDLAENFILVLAFDELDEGFLEVMNLVYRYVLEQTVQRATADTGAG